MSFSISEIMVIMLIALLVIKPEQLPDVAFSLGRFVQSLREMMTKMKAEVNHFIEPNEKTDEQKREP